jgi:hypothetical protein
VQVGPQDRLLLGVRRFRRREVLTTAAEQQLPLAGGAQVAPQALTPSLVAPAISGFMIFRSNQLGGR